MAHLYGHKSKYIASIERKNVILWIACFVVIELLILSLRWLKLLSTGMFFIALAGYAVLFVIVGRFMRHYNRGFFKAFDGMFGEKRVRNILAQLPDTYSVFWGLQLRDRCDIDFVVSGPTGIFAIEVKSHIGTIGLNGNELLHHGYAFKEKDVLWQAMSEAMDLHTHLLQTLHKEIYVTPVIVFSSRGARVHFGLKKVRNVYVIQKAWLLKLIQSPVKTPIAETGDIDTVLQQRNLEIRDTLH